VTVFKHKFKFWESGGKEMKDHEVSIILENVSYFSTVDNIDGEPLCHFIHMSNGDGGQLDPKEYKAIMEIVIGIAGK